MKVGILDVLNKYINHPPPQLEAENNNDPVE